MANILDCNIIVSPFKFPSCYYVHFSGVESNPALLVHGLLSWDALQLAWFGSSQSRPPYKGTGKSTFISCILEPQEYISPGSGWARFIPWCLRHSWECWLCLEYSPTPGPTLKRPCATLVWQVVCTINTSTLIRSSPCFFFFAQ